MTQQTSPFLDFKWGWDLGESGWNSGMDENLLKLSALFNGNIDGIVSTLPPAVEGSCYFLTTDKRIYYVAGGAYYSSPVPLWYEFSLKASGDKYQFNGSSLVAIPSPTDIADLQSTVEDLDTAAFQPSSAFASSTSFNTLSADFTNTVEGTGLHPSMFGIAVGGDVTALLNSNQGRFDLQGDSYILTGPVVNRSGDLLNGSLTYSGGLPVSFNNAIVDFTGRERIDARALKVYYTGSTPGVRGISARGGTNKISLRGAYVEGTTGQGIRIQGCDDPDLTGAGAVDCMKDAVGSSDLANSYGAIAIFGGTSVTNRAILKDLYIRSHGTGLSVMYGNNHIIHNCDIAAIDRMESPALAMGIYTGGLLTNISITHNRVSHFPLEGIDVHNTGASAEHGVTGVIIADNYVRGCSYYGISVVSADSIKIVDCTVERNVVENDPTGAVFGYSGGILIENVNYPKIRNNKCASLGQTPTTTSYGLFMSKCQFPYVEGNSYLGAWDIYEFYSDWENLQVTGTYGAPIPAGKIGIQFSQVRASASAQLSRLRLVGVDSTAKTIRQTGVPMTITVLSDSYINGQVEISSLVDSLIADNVFRNFSGALTLGSGTVEWNNPGWKNSQAGTTKATPGTVNRWFLRTEGTTTYFIPGYTSTTS